MPLCLIMLKRLLMPFDLHVSLLEMLKSSLCDGFKTPNELHHLNDDAE